MRASAAIAFGALLLTALPACSNRPKTHAVQGKIELAGGNVEVLQGSHVEGSLVSDDKVRASGVIQKDGTFKLETNHAGATFAGAREGKFEVRLILADDNVATLRKAQQAVAPRFLDFKSSGLTIDVPSKEPVVLKVGPQ